MKRWLQFICRFYCASVIGVTVFLFGVMAWFFSPLYSRSADYGMVFYSHVLSIVTISAFVLPLIAGVIYLGCRFAQSEPPRAFNYCFALAILDVLLVVFVFPPVAWA